MRRFDSRWTPDRIAVEMRRVACRGTWRGTPNSQPYLDRCKAFHQPTGTQLVFTRDCGHHTSGWWKNPDYEYCWHLSLSFVDPETLEIDSQRPKLVQDWLGHFFGNHRRLIWAEPPYSPRGKKLDIWHYRLFVHNDWQTPLLPRGEVYTTEFTEPGWMSYSDVEAQWAEAETKLIERMGNV